MEAGDAVLDTFTLYSIVFGTTTGGATLLWLYASRTPDAVGARAWSGGLGLLAVYFGCLVGRSYLPEFIGVSLANGCVAGGLALLHLGACQITRRRWPAAWHITASVGLVVVVALFFQDVTAGYRARVILSSLVTAAQCVAIVVTLLASSQCGEEERLARRFGAVIISGGIVLQLVRAVIAQNYAAPDTQMSRTAASYWSAAGFLFFSLAIPFLITYINEARARHDLRHTVRELQEAMAEVKTLRGLIPICASCRRVRDTDDAWHSIERYLSDHTDAQLSHGVCPDCMRKLYPDFADEILNHPRK